MNAIQFSVGNKGYNLRSDVIAIQTLLNKNITALKPLLPLKTDGVCGPLTIGLIKEYQRRALDHKWPDGLIEKNGKTLESLVKHELSPINKITPSVSSLLANQISNSFVNNTSSVNESSGTLNLNDRHYEIAAIELGVEVAAIKAVAQVESSGSGFTSNGLVRILFEGHKFHERTSGQHSKSHPNISHAKADSSKYSKGSLDVRVEREHARLNQAISLDRIAALESASWGKFQIMGFNYKDVGWNSVDSFIHDMKKSEIEHLRAFIGFVKFKKLSNALKIKDWATFARIYNGPQYHFYEYDLKMAVAYDSFKGK
jgi:hypothetical protein